MMALEHKESVQINSEAASKCLQSNRFPHNLHFNGSSSEPIFPYDIVAWPTFNPEAPNMQQYHMNGFGSQYPFPLENQFQCALYNMQASHALPYNFRFQDFHYFVVIDFEATCDKENNPHPQEIIEFPSVIVNSFSGQLEACFQTYVRPTCNQHLTDFCKDLTGIQQVQVDRGVTLSEALLRHDRWLETRGIKNSNFAVVTWSNWDCRVMLESECRFKKIRKPPYFNRWINLRVPFREVFGRMKCNLKEAVEIAGLAWQGRAHCGLDDAKNTARLLSVLMHRGFRFAITNSLSWQQQQQQQEYQSTENKMAYAAAVAVAYHPQANGSNQIVEAYQHHCFCGVKSSRVVVRKPGPKQGSAFFGCGNWTASRGARCNFFEWAAM